MNTVKSLVNRAQRVRNKGLNHLRRVLGRSQRISTGPAIGLRFDSGRAEISTFISGGYETPVQEALSTLLFRGAVFYDIGANVGFFSMLAAKRVGPTGSIQAFEPVPENAATIERNTRLNSFSNINVVRLAAASKTGRAELLLTKDVGGATLKTAGIPPDQNGEIDVETVAIDELIQSKGLRKPDVVKIDVEGAELDVLNGMRNVLQKKKPIMIIEFDDASLPECEGKLAACREFLEGFGYRTRTLENSYNDDNWIVRHMVAQHPGTPMPESRI